MTDEELTQHLQKIVTALGTASIELDLIEEAEWRDAVDEVLQEVLVRALLMADRLGR